MDFLKAILGEELFKQVETALNAYNGNEENKDKQVKLANLASGEYVGKGKYDALDALLKGKETELDTANGLIAELKKGTKGNEELQGKITAYEGQIEQLQKQLQETKIKSAVKVALLSEKALDVDYLTYRLEKQMAEDGKALELDDADNIKGWKDLLSGLKTQFPNQFEAEGQRRFLDSSLPPTGGDSTVTLEQFHKMGVEERSKFKAENEALYNQYRGN